LILQVSMLFEPRRETTGTSKTETDPELELRVSI